MRRRRSLGNIQLWTLILITRRSIFFARISSLLFRNSPTVFSFMISQVLGQDIGSRESFGTYRTWKWLFTGMSAFVSF